MPRAAGRRASTRRAVVKRVRVRSNALTCVCLLAGRRAPLLPRRGRCVATEAQRCAHQPTNPKGPHCSPPRCADHPLVSAVRLRLKAVSIEPAPAPYPAHAHPYPFLRSRSVRMRRSCSALVVTRIIRTHLARPRVLAHNTHPCLRRMGEISMCVVARCRHTVTALLATRAR